MYCSLDALMRERGGVDQILGWIDASERSHVGWPWSIGCSEASWRRSVVGLTGALVGVELVVGLVCCNVEASGVGARGGEIRRAAANCRWRRWGFSHDGSGSPVQNLDGSTVDAVVPLENAHGSTAPCREFARFGKNRGGNQIGRAHV